MKLPYLIGLITISLASGCKKTEIEPKEEYKPQHTEVGANKLSCKVNGVWHHYTGKGTYSDDNGVYYHQAGSTTGLCTKIFADEADYNDFIMIDVNTVDIELNKQYTLSSEEGNSAQYVPNGQPQTTKLNKGYVKFTRYDKEVASGEFAFTSYRDNDSTVITEGFFDISMDK